MNVLVNLRTANTIDPREDRAVFRRTFDGLKGVDFSAYNEAVEFLRQRGFSVGETCRGKPCGVMYGRDWDIAKWCNLTGDEQAQLHGTVTGEMRYGPVRVAIFWTAPAFAIAAVAEPYIADRIAE
jgi:hypothetical protein